MERPATFTQEAADLPRSPGGGDGLHLISGPQVPYSCVWIPRLDENVVFSSPLNLKLTNFSCKGPDSVFWLRGLPAYIPVSNSATAGKAAINGKEIKEHGWVQ